MKLKINTKEHEVSSSTLFALRKELGIPDSFITLFKGFATTSDESLNDGDSVIFMDKDEIPSGELLKEMMRARNTPSLNAALDDTCVGVAGLGGLGSSVATSLARVGVAKLVLVDFDIVDASNLNRQQYFTENIGQKKTTAMKEIIAKINPFVDVKTHDIYLDENNVNEIFAHCDIVAECFDNVKSKSMIINYIKKPLIAASGVAGYGRSEDIKITKFSKSVRICGDLKDGAGIGNGLMAPRVGLAAMMQANIILEFIANGKKLD